MKLIRKRKGLYPLCRQWWYFEWKYLLLKEKFTITKFKRLKDWVEFTDLLIAIQKELNITEDEMKPLLSENLKEIKERRERTHRTS